MHLLVTGSSGRLGRHLMNELARRGHDCVGLDQKAGPATQVVASILSRRNLHAIFRGRQFDGVVHAAAVHRPQLGQIRNERFHLVNVEGTRRLLDLANQAGIGRFVFTSTTAVMTDSQLASGEPSHARWLTEDVPCAPADLYGQTKLIAENLCREHHAATGMNIVILRPSRFFHRDLLPHSNAFTQANHRANEFLNRRASVADVAMAHALAIEKADQLRMGLFIISAPTPFTRDDCAALAADAPTVVEHYFPAYPRVYRERGWKMYKSLDRVCVSKRACRMLGMTFSQTFQSQLGPA